MRTVLLGVAGRASLILVAAGMVGSAALSASPAAAQSKGAQSNGSAVEHRHGPGRGGDTGPVKTRIGDAVKYVKAPDGSIVRVR